MATEGRLIRNTAAILVNAFKKVDNLIGVKMVNSMIPRKRAKWMVWFLIFALAFTPLLSSITAHAADGSAPQSTASSANAPATVTSSTYAPQDPLAPQNLRVIPSSITSTEAAIEWDYDPNDPNHKADIDVWHADTDEYFTWGSGDSRTIDSLKPNTTYRLYATWYERPAPGAALRHKSNVVEFTTLDGPGKPEKTAGPANLRLVEVTHNQATFEWDYLPNDPNDIDVWNADTDGYITWGNLTTHAVSGLEPETTYRIYITWYDHRPSKAFKSNILEFTTTADNTVYEEAPLAPPSHLKVTDVSADKVTLSWGSSPRAAGYHIYVNGTLEGTTSGHNNTTITYGPLKTGETYTFAVSAVNDDEPPSENSNLVHMNWGELAQPKGLQIATSTRSLAALGWAPVPGATSYDIYQNGMKVGSSSENRYLAKGLEEGSTYRYKIVAANRLWSSAESEEITVVPGSNYNNITYYSSWSASPTGRNFHPKDIDVSQITHINYAFADLCWKKFGSAARACEDPNIPAQNRYVYNGEMIIGDPEFDFVNFKSLAEVRDQNPHLKLLISVGGWSWSNHFSNMARTEETRRSFADSAVKFLREYKLDGLDIDWEYPVEGGEDDNSRSPEDPVNFTLLMKTVREALDAAGSEDNKYYLLTIASGQGDNFVRNVDLANSVQYLDFINIMTYDFSGSWETLAHHNSPLLYDKEHPLATSTAPRNHVLGGLLGHLIGGVPQHKLMAGVPYYGKAWADCPANGQYQTCGSILPGTWEAGILDFTDIEENFLNKNGYVRYWNEAAKVPYLYSEDTKGFVTYNDQVTMMYTASIVKSLDIAGVMSWDVSGDRNRTLTTQLVHDLPIDGRVNSSALAAPGQLALASKSANSLQIQWGAVTEATEYEVYVNNAMVGTTTASQYTINSLSPNTAYQIHVLAIAKSDEQIEKVSAASNVLTAQTSIGAGSGGSGGSGSSGTSSSGSGSTPPAPQKPKPEGQLDAKVVLDGNKALVTLPADTAVEAIHNSNSLNFQIAAGDQAKQAELEIPAEVIAALAAKGPQSSLSLLLDGREHRIPTALIAGEGNASISIVSPAPAETAALKELLPGKKMLTEPTVLRIEKRNADNTTIGLKHFGKSMVSEFITLDAGGIDVKSLIGIVYIPDSNEIRSVPTVVKVNSDGTITVEIKKTGNGIYALAQSSLPNLLDVSPWATKDVAEAIAKLIAASENAQHFGGKQETTRAEIISMIVRGLGIIPETSESVFADVDPQSKYANDIAAAYAAGLIKGRTGTAFDPNGLVTRQELAIMLANAMSYAGKENAAGAGALDRFKDQQAIASYAREAMASMVEHNIIHGMSADELAPGAYVTREQNIAAVMRMLRALQLSN